SSRSTRLCEAQNLAAISVSAAAAAAASGWLYLLYNVPPASEAYSSEIVMGNEAKLLKKNCLRRSLQQGPLTSRGGAVGARTQTRQLAVLV
ncbi:unnamed protein product, partial [Ectocarpus sp. 6 AP-2014]